jgi:hypothetical protein
MTSYSQLFDTFGNAFERALGLPANFFLQQNQTVSENIAQSTTQTPYGRLWIDALGEYGIVAETLTNVGADNVLSTLQSPGEFNLIVHFYREGARDLARRLSILIWSQPVIDAFNAINLTVVDTSGAQNVPDVRQQAWSDHCVMRIPCTFVDEERTTGPAITSPGNIILDVQIDGRIIGVPINATA